MKRLIYESRGEDIVAYIDGCCSMNPGPAGSAVVFYKRTVISDPRSSNGFDSDTDAEQTQKEMEQL